MMVDKKRVELLLSTAEALGLKPRLVNNRGLVSIEINGKERYLLHKASNPNSAMASWLSENKYISRVIFERNGLPNIPFCLPASTTEAKNFLSQHGRIIVKPVRGSKSKDIHLVTNEDELNELDIGLYILEKFIKGQEIRLLVVSGKVEAVHYKVYDGDINNPDTVQRVSIKKDKWDERLVRLAVRAADTIGLRFAAVDFLVDKVGSAFILEINSAPGLDRFQEPNQGPPLDIMKLYLEEVVKIS